MKKLLVLALMVVSLGCFTPPVASAYYYRGSYYRYRYGGHYYRYYYRNRYYRHRVWVVSVNGRPGYYRYY